MANGAVSDLHILTRTLSRKVFSALCRSPKTPEMPTKQIYCPIHNWTVDARPFKDRGSQVCPPSRIHTNCTFSGADASWDTSCSGNVSQNRKGKAKSLRDWPLRTIGWLVLEFCLQAKRAISDWRNTESFTADFNIYRTGTVFWKFMLRNNCWSFSDHASQGMLRGSPWHVKQTQENNTKLNERWTIQTLRLKYCCLSFECEPKGTQCTLL